MMSGLFPSLNALRAFEAAARHGSYSQAAEELCVTHAAVSQQVRQLEESIGVRLFVRNGRGMKLTEGGQELQVSVRSAFRLLERGVFALRDRKHQQRLR